MEQLTNKDKFNTIFSALADHIDRPEISSEELDAMVSRYPYCQPLRMLNAVASKSDSEKLTNILPLTALYSPERTILKQLIYHPERFSITEKSETVSAEVFSGVNLPADSHDFNVAGEEIRQENHTEDSLEELYEEIGDVKNFLTADSGTTIPSENDLTSPELSSADFDSEGDFSSTEVMEIEKLQPELPRSEDPDSVAVEVSEENENFLSGNTGYSEISSTEVMEAGDLQVEVPEGEKPEVAAAEEEESSITAETGDNAAESTEIMETADLANELSVAGNTAEQAAEVFIPETVIPDLEKNSVEDTIEPDGTENAEDNILVEPETKQESIAFDSIAGADYFIFDKSAVDPLKDDRAVATDRQIMVTAKSEPVAKYHDDKMPYTFLWWLQKTRNEHANTYQPYSDQPDKQPAGLKKNSPEELNHQIIENIFHLQEPLVSDVESKSANQPAELANRSKEHKIIEKFITEEPQIKPPKPDKIDTENKARKSSEDSGDIISETLAQIYTDQMLYHKAIDTYNKLSLKFPEKKPYFADRISEIEKKIN